MPLAERISVKGIYGRAIFRLCFLAVDVLQSPRGLGNVALNY
jgi:hypothetical protein